MARTIYVPQADAFIDFSETATDDQINAYIRSKYPLPVEPPPPPAPPPPEEEVGALESGFYQSLGRLEAAGGKAAQATGLESLSDYLFRKSQESQEYAAKYKPDVADISQISGPTDVAKFAGSTILQSAPESVAGIGGALIGGSIGALGGPAAPVTIPLGSFIGSAIASLPFFMGGNLQRQAQEQNIPLEQTSGYAASAGAFSQAPLQAAFDVLLKGKLPISGVAVDVVRKSFLKEVAKTAGEGAGMELLTEPAQQAIELAQANPEKLLEFGPEVQKELLNAAAGGVLAGGTLGGVGGAIGTIGRPTEADLAQKEIGETVAESQQKGAEMQRSAQINMGV